MNAASTEGGGIRPQPNRKRNGDLRRRPPELQAEMARRLIEEGWTQRQLIAWLAGEHQITTSQSAVSKWRRHYQNRPTPRAFDAAVAKHLEEVRKLFPKWTEERLFEEGQKMFAKLAFKDGNLEAWAVTQELTIKRRTLKLSETEYRDQRAAEKAKKRAGRRRAKPGGLTKKSIREMERALKLL